MARPKRPPRLRRAQRRTPFRRKRRIEISVVSDRLRPSRARTLMLSLTKFVKTEVGPVRGRPRHESIEWPKFVGHLRALFGIAPNVRHPDDIGWRLGVPRRGDRAVGRAASAASNAAHSMASFARDVPQPFWPRSSDDESGPRDRSSRLQTNLAEPRNEAESPWARDHDIDRRRRLLITKGASPSKLGPRRRRERWRGASAGKTHPTARPPSFRTGALSRR
jgi:hypothetical protein